MRLGSLALLTAVTFATACASKPTPPGATPSPSTPVIAAPTPVKPSPAAKAPADEAQKADKLIVSLGAHLAELLRDLPLCEPAGRRTTTFDVNGDGRPDVWKHYDGKLLVCKRADMNHDSRVDYWTGYAPNGQRAFERFDFDGDGKVDAHTQFSPATGKKRITARDSDMDGRYDVLQLHDAGGVMTQLLRDRNGDGNVDVWETYGHGHRLRVLYDNDYDGKVDKRETR